MYSLRKFLGQNSYLLLKELEESVNRLEESLEPNSDPVLKERQSEEQRQEVQKLKKSVNGLKEFFVQKNDPLLKELADNMISLKTMIQQDTGLLQKQLEKSLNLLWNMCLLGNLEGSLKPEALADAPHIYLELALLDEYNDNLDGGISILQSAVKQFGGDRAHSPWILFNINHLLGLMLDDHGHDAESIFLYLDEALEIAQDTLGEIDKSRQPEINDAEKEFLDDFEELFEFAEINVKNSLAFISAQKKVRKFKALQYAEQNYNILKNLHGFTKARVIDTYGYAKMAFVAGETLHNFDEIKRARALFQEALSHIKRVKDRDRETKEVKHYGIITIRSHLDQANRLLENL